ncbi:hypothetical protein IAR55_006742 [Kwoniella newhampshirensis]|uniref:Uncharacterized protein n=1 Tax=Kwoniella newhampshirensis TaxID=1651941 RepID=A0AAW0YGE1_9TREE
MLRPTQRNMKRIYKGKGRSLPPSKRPRATSTSRSNSDADSEDDNDIDERQAMLAALEARSRAMLGLDPAPRAESSKQARKKMRAGTASLSGSDDDEDEDSDGGDVEAFSSDDGWGAEDGFVTDSEDELVGQAKGHNSRSVIKTTVEPRRPLIPEVIFDDNVSGRSKKEPFSMSPVERKAFLMGNTAKLMGVKIERDYGPKTQRRTRNASEEEEDQSNLKLDRTLHDMLLTSLIPDAAADSASRPVDKRNAMTSRLLELASYELPGQGSKTVSSAHLSSHPARIRTGMLHAKAKRAEKVIAEAKAAGNYHKGLGGLEDGAGSRKGPKGKLERRAEVGVETGKKKGMEARKKGDSERGRGLGMGVGRFEGGMLKLSEKEIARGSGELGGGNRFKGKGKKGKRR